MFIPHIQAWVVLELLHQSLVLLSNTQVVAVQVLFTLKEFWLVWVLLVVVMERHKLYLIQHQLDLLDQAV